MTDTDHVTGIPDAHYGLVSVLYHACQGGETSQQYIDDAKAAADDELVSFFEEVRSARRDRVDKATRLLAARLQFLHVA